MRSLYIKYGVVLAVLILVIICILINHPNVRSYRPSEQDKHSILTLARQAVHAKNNVDLALARKLLWDKSNDMLILNHIPSKQFRKPLRTPKWHLDNRYSKNKHLLRIYLIPIDSMTAQELLIASGASKSETDFQQITHGKYPADIVAVAVTNNNGERFYLPMIKEKGCPWKMMSMYGVKESDYVEIRRDFYWVYTKT